MFGRAQNSPFKKADKKAMGTLFDYLQVCLEQVVKDNELGALQQALEGGYVEPGPGGDPIRWVAIWECCCGCWRMHQGQVT